MSIDWLSTGSPEEPDRDVETADAGTDLTQFLVPRSLRGSQPEAPRLSFGDMTLPVIYRSKLEPALAQLGWRYEEDTLEQMLSRDMTISFRYTLLKNGTSRAVLWLAGEQLRTMHPGTMRLLNEVRDAFRSEHKRLYVVHDDSLSLGYRLNMKSDWPGHHVTPKFLWATDVNTLPVLSDQDLEGQVTDWFELNAPAEPPRATASLLPASEIPPADLRSLAAHLSVLVQWSENNERRRRVFARSAAINLDNFAFAGDAEVTAQEFIFSIPDGELKNVLDRVKEEEDLSVEGHALVERLLSSYRFVSAAAAHGNQPSRIPRTGPGMGGPGSQPDLGDQKTRARNQRLRKEMVETVRSIAALKIIAGDLGVNLDEVPGSTLTEKCFELIEIMARQGPGLKLLLTRLREDFGTSSEFEEIEGELP